MDLRDSASVAGTPLCDCEKGGVPLPVWVSRPAMQWKVVSVPLVARRPGGLGLGLGAATAATRLVLVRWLPGGAYHERSRRRERVRPCDRGPVLWSIFFII